MLWGVVAVLASYIVGGFPTAIFAGKIIRGIDIRQHGSRNAGATNVWRVLGAGPGLSVLLIDAGKGVLAVMGIAPLAVTLAGGVDATGADYAAILAILCGFGTIVGHIWTVWARFKGGKGVGTSAGVFFALAPWCGLAAFLTFAVTLAICRYVSLGSICAAFVLASSAIIQSLTSYPTQLHPATAAIATIVATVVIVMHHGNISRLLNGTENRFGKPSSAAPTDSGEQSG